jgi:hypothetical protein
MKLYFFCIVIFCSVISFSQNINTVEENSTWDFSTSLYFYFIPEDFFILPIVTADKNTIHLEARYNYEDRNTFSGWIGYNFKIGDELEFTATPMIAAVLGNLNGVAPGLELDLLYSNFELYSESEYVFNFADGSENYFYIWTELTYSPIDWAWFGLVGQRTRAYQIELDVQQGFVLGASYNNFLLSGYIFNVFNDDSFFVLSAEYVF